MFAKKLVKRFRRMLARKLASLLKEVEHDIARDSIPHFSNSPKNLSIDFPRRIVNSGRMWLGDDISLGPGCFLMAVTRYPGPAMNAPGTLPQRTFDSKISIGNRVTSTGGLQLVALKEITIGDDVLLATNVNLTDGLHGYQDANIAYKYQPMWKVEPITIKQGCWIGQNVVVLPGVTIGEFAIIGANSVVTKSIPARCIAVGAPARVIKQWDEATECWLPVDTAQADPSEPS